MRAELQWLILLAGSLAVSMLWGATGLPAALLLGPMIAGIACGVYGLRLTVPPRVEATRRTTTRNRFASRLRRRT